MAFHCLAGHTYLWCTSFDTLTRLARLFLRCYVSRRADPSDEVRKEFPTGCIRDEPVAPG